MAVISINVPDSVVPDAIDALAWRAGFESGTDEEKEASAKAELLSMIGDEIRNYDHSQEAKKMREQAALLSAMLNQVGTQATVDIALDGD